MNRARLLDLTRLVSRAGRALTGVDRVELAYLRHISEDEGADAFGLVRTSLGYLLLEREGLRAIRSAVEQDQWGRIDLLSRLNRRISPSDKLGQSLARRHALSRSTHSGLSRLISSELPQRFVYINVGHSNLSQQSLQPFAAHPGAEIVVLVHDTIPLDFPEYQRPGSVAVFEDKLRLVASYADRVIGTTRASLASVRNHLERLGRVPPLLPAVLGVEVPEPVELRFLKPPTRPYFVSVGTIEPRKNHSLLLDIWEAFDGAGPSLLICGHRGWANEAVFKRLDDGIQNVTEIAGLTDGEIATLLKGSCGLLFPSFAEGFGFPPAEASALGVPVLCADLPACREVLGKSSVYLDSADRYLWEKAIKTLANGKNLREQAPFKPPTWENHFRLVFSEAS